MLGLHVLPTVAVAVEVEVSSVSDSDGGAYDIGESSYLARNTSSLKHDIFTPNPLVTARPPAAVALAIEGSMRIKVDQKVDKMSIRKFLSDNNACDSSHTIHSYKGRS